MSSPHRIPGLSVFLPSHNEEGNVERVVGSYLKELPRITDDYEVIVVHKEEQGWYLSRKVIFSRTDLLPHRQLIYDERGNLVTDAHYEDFKDYIGIMFPNQIDIWRPQEEYAITLKMVKLQLNQPLTDEQFALQQPPGAEVVNLDQHSSMSQAPGLDGVQTK